MKYFNYTLSLPLRADPQRAGFFASRGLGRRPRRRPPCCEIIFVRSGTLEIQQEFSVGPGEALLLWAEQEPLEITDNLPGLEFFWVQFDLFPAQEAPEREASERPVQVPQHAAVANPQFLEALFRHYLHEQAAKRLDPVCAALLISLMLCEIARPAQPANTAAVATLAGRADTYIHTHCREALTPSQVAKELLCNPSYLSRIYHQDYGRTLTQAINHYRMEYAQQLLGETNQSVSEIARACGMEDTSYFLKLFKRQTGMTALAYRRLQMLSTINMS